MCASVWNGDEETHRRPAAGAKSQKQARMLCTRPMRVNQIQRETSKKRSITNRKSSFFFLFPSGCVIFQRRLIFGRYPFFFRRKNLQATQSGRTETGKRKRGGFS